MWGTAAPVYFPIEKGYIDGGVFANNPSLCAMTRVLANIPQLSSRDVSVLSIGTGMRPMRIDVENGGSHSWGLGRWAPYLVDLLFDSSNRTVNLHMAYLLGQVTAHNALSSATTSRPAVPLENCTHARTHARVYMIVCRHNHLAARTHLSAGQQTHC